MYIKAEKTANLVKATELMNGQLATVVDERSPIDGKLVQRLNGEYGLQGDHLIVIGSGMGPSYAISCNFKVRPLVTGETLTVC